MGEELTKGYVYPQACGARTDVRWLAVQPSSGPTPSSSGPGLLVYGSQPLSFALLPASDEAIEAAAHPHELGAAAAELDAPLHLSVDHLSMGVGGDVGWLRTVRPEYMVPAGTHRWTLILSPLAGATGQDDLLAAAAPVLPPDLIDRVQRSVVHEATPWSRRVATFWLPAPPVKRAVAVAVWAAAAPLVVSWMWAALMGSGEQDGMMGGGPGR